MFQAQVMQHVSATPPSQCTEAGEVEQGRASRLINQPFGLGGSEDPITIEDADDSTSSSSDEDEYRYEDPTRAPVEQQARELAQAKHAPSHQTEANGASTGAKTATSFFLKRTLHVGGVGLHWQKNENEIAKFFDDTFGSGTVLVAVLRQREPTETSGPHNSWALVTVSDLSVIESIMTGKDTAKIQTGYTPSNLSRHIWIVVATVAIQGCNRQFHRGCGGQGLMMDWVARQSLLSCATSRKRRLLTAVARLARSLLSAGSGWRRSSLALLLVRRIQISPQNTHSSCDFTTNRSLPGWSCVELEDGTAVAVSLLRSLERQPWQPRANKLRRLSLI